MLLNIYSIIFVSTLNVFILQLNCQLNDSDGNDCFRAAVYEHILQGNVTKDEPKVIINYNLDIFSKVAKIAAKNGANILVFPEDGLIVPEYSRDIVSTFAEKIPDPRHDVWSPCDYPYDHQKLIPITTTLSCLAKTNHIYIVADYGDSIDCDPNTDPECPKDGHYLFNTVVAFDPDGFIKAKYHKQHLFFEFAYNTPKEKYPDTYFDTTEFGRLGLQICFDILFQTPGIEAVTKYGAKTILYPTFWFDELPLRSAKQIQEGWALNNQVNLLAANVLDPKTGSAGSGIYSGSNGPMVYTDIGTKNAKLLIADIPIDAQNSRASCLDPQNRYNKTIIIDELKTNSKYKSVEKMYTKGLVFNKLVANQNTSTLCDGDFCCHIDYRVRSGQSLRDDSFWWFVGNSSGHPYTQNYPMCEEICAVFRCDDDRCQTFATQTNQTIFESLRLSAQFSTQYTYPSLTANDLTLVPKDYWTYEQTDDKVTLELDNYDKPLLTMALYARCFDRDPPPPYFND